jgi:uncharacterized protein YdhG (YjbR/CyaY superfamily)
MRGKRPQTIAEYIAAAPKEARRNLRALYAILRKEAPRAKAGLKWGSPAFEEGRILYAFAAFKSHINFMPTPSAMKPFWRELTAFRTGKGSIQFPHDRPLPATLVRKIARQRVRDLRDHDVRWM